MSAKISGKKIESASRAEDGGLDVVVAITIDVHLTPEEVLLDFESKKLKNREEIIRILKEKVRTCMTI